jgi:hypothetical protein
MYRPLPIILRVWFVVPATILLVFLGDLLFELPPGPLCDEGMVLFMEGGCDWGNSNIFFFSKAGLLVGMNLVFIAAWFLRVQDWREFIPHFAILAFLTVFFYSDADCRHYYSHPNGSIGQMTAEAIAFGALGVAILSRARVRTAGRLAGTVVLWNGAHVGAFYLALLVTNHWTWLHTFLIVAMLGGVAFAITRTLGRRERGLQRPA